MVFDLPATSFDRLALPQSQLLKDERISHYRLAHVTREGKVFVSPKSYKELPKKYEEIPNLTHIAVYHGK